MITLKRYNRFMPNNFVCEITKAMDCIKDNNKEVSLDYYLYVDQNALSNSNKIFIRIPGHTVGAIELDENMCIKNIVINEDDISKGVFLKDVNQELSQFIGREIVIES